MISKSLIGLYLGKSDIGSAYGPAGSLVVILAWIYYASLVFLFGAEFTEVYAQRYGSRADKTAAGSMTAEERRVGNETSPLHQPRYGTRTVVPQGSGGMASSGYGRYIAVALSFIAGMLIGVRRRTRYP